MIYEIIASLVTDTYNFKPIFYPGVLAKSFLMAAWLLNDMPTLSGYNLLQALGLNYFTLLFL